MDLRRKQYFMMNKYVNSCNNICFYAEMSVKIENSKLKNERKRNPYGTVMGGRFTKKQTS